MLDFFHSLFHESYGIAYKKRTSEDRFFIEECLDSNITLRLMAKALNVASLLDDITRNQT